MKNEKGSVVWAREDDISQRGGGNFPENDKIKFPTSSTLCLITIFSMPKEINIFFLPRSRGRDAYLSL